MKLSQRLTRAGLAFIVFGTAVSLFPTSGNASAATDGCTIATQSYSVGNVPQDPATNFPATSGSFIILNSYLGSDPATAVSVSDSNSNFITNIGNGTISTKANATGTDNVTVSFAGGRIVSYTVTAQ